ncbi:hypothetical protein JTB14_014778 [Gonioctena quinquepunctata]|nr:hypothetical protein JTB14_014778 [Gonioctena quinquepunctata]
MSTTSCTDFLELMLSGWQHISSRIVEKPEKEHQSQGNYSFTYAILGFKLELERMKVYIGQQSAKRQLKRRFPVLQYTVRIQLDRVAAVIISCAVLHNISKHLNDGIPAEKWINANQQQVVEEENDLENADAEERRNSKCNQPTATLLIIMYLLSINI